MTAETLGVHVKDLAQWPWETLELQLAYADGRALAEWEHSRQQGNPSG